MKKEIDWDLIDRYFDQDLTEEEKTAFQALCDRDPEFAKAVESQKMIKMALDPQVQSFQRLVEKGFPGKGKGGSDAGTKLFLWMGGIAACLALAIVAGVQLRKKQIPDPPPAEEKIAFNKMGSTDPKLSEIEALINQKRFGEALPLLKSAAAQNTGNYYVQYVLGIAFYQVDSLVQADLVFDKIIAAGALDAPRAYYKKAQIAQKTGNRAAFEKYLEKVIKDTNTGTELKKAAEALLEKGF